MDIDPAALRAQVPTLILQPLVENAMRHGVDSNAEACRIQIAARQQNGEVLLEVRDDGKDLQKIVRQKDSGGLGLKNTRARLSELYGEDYNFSLAVDDRWTTAQIVIPFLSAAELPEGERVN